MENNDFQISLVQNWFSCFTEANRDTGWTYFGVENYNLRFDSDSFAICTWLSRQPNMTCTLQKLKETFPINTDLLELINQLRYDLAGKLNIISKS